MSLLGFPILRYIDINDSEQVLRAIHMTDPDVPIDLILHTPGGLVLAALQIARAIDRHKAKVTVFVPHYAMSGGTLIALGGRRDRHVRACGARPGGPPVLGEFPAASLLKVHPGEADRGGRRRDAGAGRPGREGVFQLREAVKALLVPKLGQERGEELAGILTEGDLDARLSDHLRRGDPVEAAGQLRHAR